MPEVLGCPRRRRRPGRPQGLPAADGRVRLPPPVRGRRRRQALPDRRRGRARQDDDRPRRRRQGCRAPLGQATSSASTSSTSAPTATSRGRTSTGSPCPARRRASFPSRITLLPKTVTTLDRKLNFISITPGTSFNLRSSGGTAEERALCTGSWRSRGNSRGVAPSKVLAGLASFDNFPWYVRAGSRRHRRRGSGRRLRHRRCAERDALRAAVHGALRRHAVPAAQQGPVRSR